jgi:cytochrome c oxidase subunit II
MFSGGPAVSDRVIGHVFLYVGAISVILLALITFLMIYFVIRYSRKRNPQASDIEGSRWLEITWTAVPTFLVLTMFYYGMTGFQFIRKPPEGAMKVKVTARMWSWGFEYENGIKTTELRLPVGKPVYLSLHSEDVIHSFYVPAFRVKQDAVPGFDNALWFEPTQTGTYDVLCAEYCGLRHSYMMTKVLVVSQEEFDRWHQQALNEVKARKPGLSGAQLIQEKGCRACHSIDGTPLVGPTFKGLFGHPVTVVAAGQERQVTADEAYIRRSVSDPGAEIVKGYPPIMPPQKLTEDEIKAMIEYLRELK